MNPFDTVKGDWLIITAATGWFHALRLRTDGSEDPEHDLQSLRSSSPCTTFVRLQVSPLMYVNCSLHVDIRG
jgi:hypothetical protein